MEFDVVTLINGRKLAYQIRLEIVKAWDYEDQRFTSPRLHAQLKKLLKTALRKADLRLCFFAEHFTDLDKLDLVKFAFGDSV